MLSVMAVPAMPVLAADGGETTGGSDKAGACEEKPKSEAEAKKIDAENGGTACIKWWEELGGKEEDSSSGKNEPKLPENAQPTSANAAEPDGGPNDPGAPKGDVWGEPPSGYNGATVCDGDGCSPLQLQDRTKEATASNQVQPGADAVFNGNNGASGSAQSSAAVNTADASVANGIANLSAGEQQQLGQDLGRAVEESDEFSQPAQNTYIGGANTTAVNDVGLGGVQQGGQMSAEDFNASFEAYDTANQGNGYNSMDFKSDFENSDTGKAYAAAATQNSGQMSASDFNASFEAYDTASQGNGYNSMDFKSDFENSDTGKAYAASTALANDTSFGGVQQTMDRTGSYFSGSAVNDAVGFSDPQVDSAGIKELTQTAAASGFSEASLNQYTTDNLGSTQQTYQPWNRENTTAALQNTLVSPNSSDELKQAAQKALSDDSYLQSYVDNNNKLYNEDPFKYAPENYKVASADKAGEAAELSALVGSTSGQSAQMQEANAIYDSLGLTKDGVPADASDAVAAGSSDRLEPKPVSTVSVKVNPDGTFGEMTATPAGAADKTAGVDSFSAIEPTKTVTTESIPVKTAEAATTGEKYTAVYDDSGKWNTNNTAEALKQMRSDATPENQAQIDKVLNDPSLLEKTSGQFQSISAQNDSFKPGAAFSTGGLTQNGCFAGGTSGDCVYGSQSVAPTAVNDAYMYSSGLISQSPAQFSGGLAVQTPEATAAAASAQVGNVAAATTWSAVKSEVGSGAGTRFDSPVYTTGNINTNGVQSWSMAYNGGYSAAPSTLGDTASTVTGQNMRGVSLDVFGHFENVDVAKNVADSQSFSNTTMTGKAMGNTDGYDIGYFAKVRDGSSNPQGVRFTNLETAAADGTPIGYDKSSFRADGGQFGACRPLNSCTRRHGGDDYSDAPGATDTAIRSSSAGIAKVYPGHGGAGNFVQIVDPETGKPLTGYMHLSEVSVKDGDQVILGQSIGTVGDTGGVSSAPHLHYEVYNSNGTRVDPQGSQGVQVASQNFYGTQSVAGSGPVAQVANTNVPKNTVSPPPGGGNVYVPRQTVTTTGTGGGANLGVGGPSANPLGVGGPSANPLSLLGQMGGGSAGGSSSGGSSGSGASSSSGGGTKATNTATTSSTVLKAFLKKLCANNGKSKKCQTTTGTTATSKDIEDAFIAGYNAGLAGTVPEPDQLADEVFTAAYERGEADAKAAVKANTAQ